MKATYYKLIYKGYEHFITVDEPSECPICKHALKPNILSKNIIDDNSETPALFVTYLCTSCYQAFICKFINLETDQRNSQHFIKNKLASIEPNKFNLKIFDECIEKVSPNFVKIYNQALEAEYKKLDEIAGIGYRKALEFLIKDFLINHENIDESKVKPTALGNCINTMIDNIQLKTVASRATWLGNDQTHYEQKYTDKDINDLKRLIELSVHWITMICLTDETGLIQKK